eukprot:m.799955 g.799955  ORF g.799955 m.799955 type:complete len:687 (-) comp59265_c3_seq6:192-2252(-)
MGTVNALERPQDSIGSGHGRQCARLVVAHGPRSIHATHEGSTALHSAVDWNRVSILAHFLTFDTLDLSVRNHRGHTPLDIALAEHRFRCYEMLVAAGANAHSHLEDATDAFFSAVAAGDAQLVEQQLEIDSSQILHTILTDPRLGQKALVIAAGLGREAVLSLLLKLKAFQAYVNARGPTGESPAMAAVAGGHLEGLNLLVAAGADVSVTNYGQTLLHTAAEAGHPAVVRRLLEIAELKAALPRKDHHGYTPLGRAVSGGNIECLEMLRAEGGDLHSCVIPYRGTALHVAALEGHAKMLAHLLSLRPCLEWIDSTEPLYGFTPFLLAVKSGSIHSCRVLLDSGANPLLTAKDRKTALHLACSEDQDEMLHFLLGLDVFRQLLDAVDDDGITALMDAARPGHVECATALLSAGADPILSDKGGQTALHLAVHSGSSGMVQLILGANQALINMQTKRGISALMAAAACNDPVNVQFLLDQGADGSLLDCDGQQALHFAAKRSRLECVKALLASSAFDINVQDSNGETPLMAAARGARALESATVQTLQLLLQHGALVHLKNKAGQTARQLVVSSRPAVEALLQEHEEYLANLGQHVKPAVREPFVLGENAVEVTPQGAVLLQLDASAPDLLQFPLSDAEADQEPANIPASTTTLLSSAQSIAAPAPAPDLALGGLDEELAQLIAEPPA